MGTLFLSVYFLIDWHEDLFITQLLSDFGHRFNFSELQFPHWSNRNNDRIVVWVSGGKPVASAWLLRSQ